MIVVKAIVSWLKKWIDYLADRFETPQDRMQNRTDAAVEVYVGELRELASRAKEAGYYNELARYNSLWTSVYLLHPYKLLRFEWEVRGWDKLEEENNDNA